MGPRHALRRGVGLHPHVLGPRQPLSSSLTLGSTAGTRTTAGPCLPRVVPSSDRGSLDQRVAPTIRAGRCLGGVPKAWEKFAENVRECCPDREATTRRDSSSGGGGLLPARDAGGRRVEPSIDGTPEPRRRGLTDVWYCHGVMQGRSITASPLRLVPLPWRPTPGSQHGSVRGAMPKRSLKWQGPGRLLRPVLRRGWCDRRK
jgi:hypothetical protein